MSYQPVDAARHEPIFINIRKLAALDVVFHGPKLILAEFGFGVLVPAVPGSMLTYAGFFGARGVPFQSVLGCYLLFVALNYVPLLLSTISIARRGSAQEEVAFELGHKERYTRKYSVQSLLLLLPLVVPILAIWQEWQKRGHE